VTTTHGQKLKYGTSTEITNAIVDVLKASKIPLLANEIRAELKKKRLKVKDTRVISMSIHYNLSNIVKRTRLGNQALGQTFVYEYSPAVEFEES